MKRNSQSGVALVITLVLLSVITFMAVTFLVVIRHEAAQVGTLTQQSNAKFAADAATEQAKAQVAAQMLASLNGLSSSLFVSTNFITNIYSGTRNITDVSYNGITSQAQLEQMLGNLLILPRAPVFIVTNKALPNNLDFRFYHDLNRNGKFDTNGSLVELVYNGGGALVPGNTNFHVGDPEWIGVLNHPEWPHSSSNLFISRYCFLALPIGDSLDFNHIHNQSQEVKTSPLGVDWGYLRNQGVGSWEINLAGFLSALNTNEWPAGPAGGQNYTYYPANNNFKIGGANGGNAFDDAAGIVQYRYNRNYGNLFRFSQMYPGSPFAITNLIVNGVDPYSYGPLMTSFSPVTVSPSQAAKYLSLNWSGSDNPSPFFTSQDFFGNIPGNGLQSFTNHLYQAGRQTDTYDQYTYYRMLSQISVGSAADSLSYPASMMLNPNYYNTYGSSPKMNLNYNNISTNITNFVSWIPVEFFTNAADRMLRAYFPNKFVIVNNNGLVLFSNYLSITNIPIYPVNLYTPAVHRILQLAANMYDATTNKNTGVAPFDFDYPSVFQPYFSKSINKNGTNIAVAGYYEVTGTANQALLQVFNAPKDLRRQNDLIKFLSANGNIVSNVNVYGVPYVIGAKPGLPGFEKFASSPMVQVQRKLEIVKNGTAISQWHTNVQYTIGISNTFGVECWYPSTNLYFSRPVNLYIMNDMSMVLTNNIGAPVYSAGLTPATPYVYNLVTNIPAGNWYGSPNLPSGMFNANTFSFKQPVNTNIIFAQDSLVLLNPAKLLATSQVGSSSPILPTPGYFVPSFGFSVTNRVRVIIQDATPGPGGGRIIDYVQLGGLSTLAGVDTYDDLNTDLTELNSTFWATNAYSKTQPAPQGIWNQVALSEGFFGNGQNGGTANNALWQSVQPSVPINSVNSAISNFNAFLNPGSAQQSMQVPFAIIAKYQKTYTWAVNDPLVHYMVSDLTDPTKPIIYPTALNFGASNAFGASGVFGRLSTNRYQPWTNNLANTAQLTVKDPGMMYSDNWQFPSSKLPNVGWLGRVHRGTPWQTVYLKSPTANTNTWMFYTGDLLTNYYNGNDMLYSMPTNDWLLMDLFTTAPNDNATRGQLSVNQTNVAAWAAILDGVVVMSNTATGFIPQIIDPTLPHGNYNNMVEYIVNGPNGINATKTNLYPNGAPMFPGGVFTSMGQILSVPQLTVNSPYLDTSSGNAALLTDEAYERIPQQIMSLLRLGTPRYVIFAYGQSLKPADHSIVQSGQFFGMCTNYQITGEVATRTVVRFDNLLVPGAPNGTVFSVPHAVTDSFNVLGPE